MTKLQIYAAGLLAIYVIALIVAAFIKEATVNLLLDLNIIGLLIGILVSEPVAVVGGKIGKAFKK